MILDIFASKVDCDFRPRRRTLSPLLSWPDPGTAVL